MLRNIIIYIILLASSFVFCVLYYEWFSWFLFLVVALVPVISLVLSLPFMIYASANGLYAECDKSLEQFQPLSISIKSASGRGIICPFIKIKFKTYNAFIERRKSIIFKYGGRIKRPVKLSCHSLSSNCGCLKISAGGGKIYDFCGIFFLPVRLKFHSEVIIKPIPEKPSVMPDIGSAVILGYKPKPGGGFSDFYELRQYREGDSLKNVHWKLSSKYDDLIVKEPSEAICKRLIVKIEMTDEPEENDFILARLAYVCNEFIAAGTEFYAYESSKGIIAPIRSKEDVDLFFYSVYSAVEQQRKALPDNAVIYSILPEREEVSEL